MDRKDAKILTLQQLYGGILPQYENLEFFKKVKVYVDDLWEDFPIRWFNYRALFQDKLL
jgi:hypothetical protein